MRNNPYYTGPVSDHFDGTRFFSPGVPPHDAGLMEILKWKFTHQRGAWTQTTGQSVDRPPAQSDRIRVAMVGHSSILLQVAGLNILLDPVWSDRASPFQWAGPRRYNPPGIAFEDLPKIDIVLISHNHYDHMDMATLRRLRQTHAPRLIAPLGNDAILKKADPAAVMETGDWGDRLSLSESVTLTVWPAYHWSARGVGDKRMALWSGFVLQTPQGVIYLAGDTGYEDGRIFRDLQQAFGPVQLAMLPIGAYEPRWFMKQQHANPAEAIKIMQDCGAEQALGMHWYTFRLTDEAQDQPEIDLQRALVENGIAPDRFLPLKPGQIWKQPD